MKKRTLAKTLAAVMTCVVAITAMIIPASAYSWYSNANGVSFHPGRPGIKISDNNSYSGAFTQGMIRSYLTVAVADWENTANGIPSLLLSGTGDSGAYIYIRGGTPYEIWRDFGEDMAIGGSVVSGLTTYKSYKSVTQNISGTNRQISRITGPVYVYIVNRFESGRFIYTDKKGVFHDIYYGSSTYAAHFNAIKHEIGHALGHEGHVSSSTDLMYSMASETDVITVSANNRKQVSQFRNAYNNGTLLIP